MLSDNNKRSLVENDESNSCEENLTTNKACPENMTPLFNPKSKRSRGRPKKSIPESSPLPIPLRSIEIKQERIDSVTTATNDPLHHVLASQKEMLYRLESLSEVTSRIKDQSKESMARTNESIAKFESAIQQNNTLLATLDQQIRLLISNQQLLSSQIQLLSANLSVARPVPPVPIPRLTPTHQAVVNHPVRKYKKKGTFVNYDPQSNKK